jgi:twitching motility protein PilT
MIDVFPAQEKDMVRAMLSESLQAVVSQTLLRNKAGDGRVAAHEILVASSAIRHLIREAKVAQMYAMMEAGAKDGMQTLDQCLKEMVRRGQVSPAEAQVYAVRKELFL